MSDDNTGEVERLRTALRKISELYSGWHGWRAREIARAALGNSEGETGEPYPWAWVDADVDECLGFEKPPESSIFFDEIGPSPASGAGREGEVKRIAGASDIVDEAACLIFDALCPGLIMGDEDRNYYEAAAKAVLALVAPSASQGDTNDLRDKIAERLWRAEYRRAFGKERDAEWAEVSDRIAAKFLYLAEAVVQLVAAPSASQGDTGEGELIDAVTAMAEYWQKRALKAEAALSQSPAEMAEEIECPNCHNANEFGDYEGPTCEVCGGSGLVRAPSVASSAPPAVNAEIETAARLVLDTFKKDREQGFRTRDKDFAIDILEMAFRMAAVPATDAPPASPAETDELRAALQETLCELTACANQLAARGLPGHEGDSVSRAQIRARAALAQSPADNEALRREHSPRRLHPRSPAANADQALTQTIKDLEWIATGSAEAIDGNYRKFAHKALDRLRDALRHYADQSDNEALRREHSPRRLHPRVDKGGKNN